MKSLSSSTQNVQRAERRAPAPSKHPLRRRFGAIVVGLATMTAGVFGVAAKAAPPSAGIEPSFIPTQTSSRDVLVTGSFVYWSNLNGGTIGRANLDGTGVNQSFISGAAGPSGLATDGTYLYWTNGLLPGPGAGTIGRALLDGTGVNDNFITGANIPIGLSYAGGMLYWANYNTRTIGRANADGTGVNQSFVTLASRPYGVVATATSLYWTNYQNVVPIATTLGKANIDGTGVNEAFITGATGPTGIDTDGTYLYWANYSEGAAVSSIGRSLLDGSSVNQTYVSPVTEAVGVAVSSTHLYWTDFLTSTVARTAFDRTAPILTVPANITIVATALPNTAVTYSAPVSATDPDDISTTLTTTCDFGTLTGGSFPVGSTTVNCTASDPVGNSVSRSFTVQVNLPPPPVITGTANIAITATSPAGAVVTYPAPTSTAGTVTCSPASGSLFAIGTATVSCSVTDALNQTTTTPFSVTVSKPAPPVLTTSANIVVTATSAQGALVSVPAPTATSGTPTCAVPSPPQFPVGVTTVLCTVTDAYAQTVTKSFQITVVTPTVVTPATVPVVAPVVAVQPPTSSTIAPTTAPPATTAPAATVPAATVPATVSPTTTTIPVTTTTTPIADAAPATAVVGAPTFTG